PSPHDCTDSSRRRGQRPTRSAAHALRGGAPVPAGDATRRVASMLRIAAAPLGGRCGQGVPREVTEVERPEEALDDEPATGRDGRPTDGQDDRPRAPHPVGARLRRLGVKLALAGLSVVLTLGVVEVVFRLLGYRPVYSVYSKPDEFFRADPELGW